MAKKEENGQVNRTLIPELASSHEEADSKMIYHLTILEENSKVIIRTSDTDVLVIALGWLENIPESINVWLKVGLYTKNSLRYIDVRELSNKLGKDLCRALPAFHVFTDCDYAAAFSRKGKICPLKTLEKDKPPKLYLKTWDSLMIYKKKNSKFLDVTQLNQRMLSMMSQT